MDNFFYSNDGGHLGKFKPCARRSSLRVPEMGTTSKFSTLLWINRSCSQNFVQVCPHRQCKRHLRVDNLFMSGSEVVGVAQLGEVFPWIGVLDASVGDMFDPHLQLMSTLRAKVVAQAKMGGEVE